MSALIAFFLWTILIGKLIIKFVDTQVASQKILLFLVILYLSGTVIGTSLFLYDKYGPNYFTPLYLIKLLS